jgi:hypothetical protein
MEILKNLVNPVYDLLMITVLPSELCSAASQKVFWI